MTNSRTLTTDEICEVFGVIPRTVRNWVAMKCPCTGRGKARRFDDAELASWLKKNNLSTKVGRPEDASDPTDPLKLAKIRKENALAEKHEIAVAEKKKELINRAEAERANVQKFTTIRNKLLGIPASAAPVLEGKQAPAIEAELENRIREILKELAK